MLQSLRIQNYALIASLDIRLERGFTVITGETGAGKSILLGAIGLLLGQRADARMVKNGATRCLIEAEFNLKGYGMADFFERHELDFDGEECIIRRELTAAGKSRAFINDTPAQVATLRELGARLIDVHSQHQNLLLAQEDFQMNVVDIVSHNADVRQRYAQLYADYVAARRRLDEAEQALADARKDEDYLRFQLAQLDELQLAPGRQEESEQEARRLEHAEDIIRTLWATRGLLHADDGQGAVAAVREASRQVGSIASLLPAADELAQRLDSCYIELRDVADELEAQASHIDTDPARLQTLNDWLSQLYSAMQKHHLQTEQQLIELTADFRSRLEAVDGGDENIAELRRQLDAATQAVREQGEMLTLSRRKAATEVERLLHEYLKPLGIPNVTFSVSFSPLPQPSPSGLDEVCFLFSANRGMSPQPIAEVASGGEIARVMLSLKAIISASVSMPTIIFDEIDTGVSGHIAESMARIMRQMGEGGRQVISITHLPQIAAMGQYHFRVFKQDTTDDTTSHIEALSDDQRVTEIAHMLSGSELTEAAIGNARALLNANA